MLPSPCIKVCRMEGPFCVGCLRTLDEIGRWGRVSEMEQRAILAAVADRRQSGTASAISHSETPPRK